MDLDSSSVTSSLATDGSSDVSVAPVATKSPKGAPKVTKVPVACADAVSVTVSAALIKAALGWSCVDQTRFHLNGLHFDGANIVATDGHRLIKITGGIVGGAPRGYTVPRETLLAACKTAGAHGSLEIGNPIDGKGTIIVRGKVANPSRYVTVLGPTIATIEYKPIDGQFPPYEQVIPSSDVVKGCHGINPAYLGDMAPVCNALDGTSGKSQRGVKLVSAAGPLDPVMYTYDSCEGTHVRFVIMPMRV